MTRIAAALIFIVGFAMVVSTIAFLVYSHSDGIIPVLVTLLFGIAGYCNMHLVKNSSRMVREFYVSLHWKKENRVYFREREPGEENPRRFTFLKFGGIALFLQAFLLLCLTALLIALLLEQNLHGMNPRRIILLLIFPVLPMIFSMTFYGIWLFRTIRFMTRYILR